MALDQQSKGDHLFDFQVRITKRGQMMKSRAYFSVTLFRVWFAIPFFLFFVPCFLSKTSGKAGSEKRMNKKNGY